MEGHPVLLQAGDWLSRYFAGERPDSGELKLDPRRRGISEDSLGGAVPHPLWGA